MSLPTKQSESAGSLTRPLVDTTESTGERRAFWASWFGWGLDAFDNWLYVYSLTAIIAALGISRAQGGSLATASLVCSALGGIFAGTLADRIGRKRMLMISVLWYAFFTALSGTAHHFSELVVFRALQGFGFGGEWAVGSVLISEWASSRHRGRTLGFMQGAWAVGWLVANFAFQVVFALAGPDPGWRYLFFLGILPALLVFYVRREVEDPPVYLETKRAKDAKGDRALTLAALFAPGIIRTTLFTTLLAIGIQGGYWAIVTWLPGYLTSERHLTALSTGAYFYPLIVGSYIGYVTAGFIHDAIGRRPTFLIFAIGSAVFVPLYTFFVQANWQLLVLGPFLGYFASGIHTGFGPYMTELFPSSVRGAGQGFAYNVGRGFAGFGPLVVGILAATHPLGVAISIYAPACYVVAMIALLFLPETRGKELVPLD
jgi:MFS family permease